MGLYKKGGISRAVILDKARKLLNERGLSIGVELIAQELGLSRGRITHFFPTKDSIMVAIMRNYEHELGELLLEFDWNKGSVFDQHFLILDTILDLQYEYRCALSFIAVMGKSQPEMQHHIEASFFNRVDGVYVRIRMMVELKLLEPRILEKDEWDVFLFQYTCLLSYWILSQEVYYRKTAYKRMKPVYLKGAMKLFLPFLTRKGKKAYQAASDNFERKTLDRASKKR